MEIDDRLITVSNAGSGCRVCNTTPCVCPGGKRDWVQVPLSRAVSPEVLAAIHEIVEEVTADGKYEWADENHHHILGP